MHLKDLNINEEILRIQKMVAEGKVSPEESVELLESVAAPRTEKPPPADAAVAASAPSRADKVYGIVGFAALLAASVLVVVAAVLNDSQRGAAIMVGAGLLWFSAALLGWIGWRSPWGKMALIGAFVLITLFAAVALFCLLAFESPRAAAPLR